MPVRDISEFTPSVDDSAVASSVPASHQVRRGEMKGSDTVWIRKQMPTATAQIEIIGQEFFRLIIPHQPETHLAQDKANGTHYILSEEVNGYRPLPTNQARNFGNGTFTGLGQVLVGSMFLQEVDLKNGNVGLNDQNQVIKIDGDWCFASEQNSQRESRLTPEGIASLPYPKDFSAFNWLDLIQQDTSKKYSNIVNHELSHSPQFRAEVNEAMLKICLMPDSFIDEFVKTHMPDDGERFISLIKSRREELKTSAYQNPSFQDYLKTAKAERDAESLAAQMTSFKANGEALIVTPANHAQLITTVQNNVSLMRTELAKIPSPQQKLIQDNQQLLTQILDHRVNDNDVLLIRYVEQAKIKIAANADNPQRLMEINNELSRVFTSVSSMSVKSIKDIAKNLRNNELSDKADRIELALANMPLEERKLVLQQASNKVKDAMMAAAAPLPKIAMMAHPDPVKKEAIFKSTSTIIENKAGQEAKPLKASAVKLEPLESSIQTSNKSSAELIQLNQQLLEQIKVHRVNDQDTRLLRYVAQTQGKIAKISDNPQQLMAMNQELNRVLTSVSSIAVHSVKENAKTSRKYGADAKADRIEHALCKMPLEERRLVLEQDTNEVQDAIEGSMFTARKEVVTNRAASSGSIASFKDIKARFAAIAPQENTVDEVEENEQDLNFEP